MAFIGLKEVNQGPRHLLVGVQWPAAFALRIPALYVSLATKLRGEMEEEVLALQFRGRRVDPSCSEGDRRSALGFHGGGSALGG